MPQHKYIEEILHNVEERLRNIVLIVDLGSSRDYYSRSPHLAKKNCMGCIYYCLVLYDETV